MKTLLQINTNVGWNSTGRIAEDIGRMAIDHGWESYIAYGRNVNGRPLSASRLVRVGNDRGVALHGLATRLFDRHGLDSHKATRNLIKRIEEINPDVIQLHNIHGYYLNYRDLFGYLARSGVPVVWTLHDCWPFTGHCAYFDMADCRRWLDGCARCPLKRVYPASWLADNSKNNYKLKKEAFTSLDNLHIVTVSHWLRSVVSRSFLGKYPSYVIYNGIEEPANIKERHYKEKIVLGAASKWDSRKGLDTFEKLRANLPPEYRIVLIGLSQNQLLNLSPGIEGLPRINERGELNNWYNRASVFVNPSLSETLSITNLEAQACGTPVVSFDSGGMSETVSPSSGLLVKTGDIAGLADAVRTIVEHPGERFGFDDCRAYIRQKFAKADCYRMYIDLYDSILDAKHIKIGELVL